MALPSSGNISLSAIKTELNETGSLASLAGRSPDGALPVSLTDFYGMSGIATPVWTAGNSVSRSDNSAVLYLKSNGTIDLLSGVDGTWLPSGEAVGSYQAKWTVSSGGPFTVLGGWNMDTWATLSTTRSVSLADLNSGNRLGTLTITIKPIAASNSLIKTVNFNVTDTGGGGPLN